MVTFYFIWIIRIRLRLKGKQYPMKNLEMIGVALEQCSSTFFSVVHLLQLFNKFVYLAVALFNCA